MKAIAINGSPRKDWNTGILLKRALEGAASRGAATELVNLYDLRFKGCTSCFACKRVDGARGVCAMRDDLTPLLETLRTADAILFGSPVYFMHVTSGMAAFLERLLFSNTIYSLEIPTVFPRKTPSAFLYTMNIKEDMAAEWEACFRSFELFVERALGEKPESLCAYNTYQYTDYAKYEHSFFSEPEKAKWKEEQFPIDCEQAYRLGARLMEKSL